MKPRRHYGWSSKGHYVIHERHAPNPRRQGCRWTGREEADLLWGLHNGQSSARLAFEHQRTLSAVEQRLAMLDAPGFNLKYDRTT